MNNFFGMNQAFEMIKKYINSDFTLKPEYVEIYVTDDGDQDILNDGWYFGFIENNNSVELRRDGNEIFVGTINQNPVLFNSCNLSASALNYGCFVGYKILISKR